MLNMSLSGTAEAARIVGEVEVLEIESDRLNELLMEAVGRLRKIPSECAKSVKESAERLTLPSRTKVHRILSKC